MRARDSGARLARRIGDVRAEYHALDQAAYDAVATTPTPTLDRLMVSLSRAADHSGLWLVTAAAVAAVGGGPGRRAAGQGVLAIGLASAVTNLGLKPVARRTRPWRSGDRPATASRRVRRPKSTSFASGHAASAFAFASGVGEAAPKTRVPLHAAAGGVAYSRVHTGVHYPSDVAVGAVTGALCAWTVRRLAARLTSGRRGRGECDDSQR